MSERAKKDGWRDKDRQRERQRQTESYIPRCFHGCKFHFKLDLNKIALFVNHNEPLLDSRVITISINLLPRECVRLCVCDIVFSLIKLITLGLSHCYPQEGEDWDFPSNMSFEGQRSSKKTELLTLLSKVGFFLSL